MRIGKLFAVSMLIMIIFAGSVFAEDRVSLGYLYGSTDNIDLVDRTNGAINQIAPTCMDLDDRGNLDLTSNLTKKFVDEMHERGILVTPFLSNHWARQKGRKAIKNAEKLSDQIIKAIEKYDLDGVNIDIENLTEDDRDNLTNFVRVLRAKMPEGKLLTVCVAANPYGRDDGWQGSYDYAQLGGYADYLFIMAYDEHSIGGGVGPVASNAFVENSIIYALQYVSKDKIVMGLPFYGRYWNNSKETGGQAVVIGAVPSLISKHKGIVEYSDEIGETKVTITVDSSKKVCKINGEELEDGTYTIWYQTDDNLKSKLAIVNKYDLLGCGVWALGQENKDVWNYFYDELNKIPRGVDLEEELVISETEYYLGIIENLCDEPEMLSTLRNMVCKEENIENKESKEMITEPHLHVEFIYKAEYNEVAENSSKEQSEEKDYHIDRVTDFKKIRRTKLEKHY